MSREYPRFIFSHPFDTKSKERFIVHTLYPQMIARVTYASDGGHYVDPLAAFVPADQNTINEIAYRMHDWYTHVRMQEAKLSFDFYDRTSDIARKLSTHSFFFNGTVSISMVFIPRMGARLDVSKDDWNVSVNFENNDTYNSVVNKLTHEYQKKYGSFPDWSL
jgi:hypothetical protein